MKKKKTKKKTRGELGSLFVLVDVAGCWFSRSGDWSTASQHRLTPTVIISQESTFAKERMSS